jgi:hypothetical protein
MDLCIKCREGLMKKMTPNLMHTSSEKNACKPRSECQHVEEFQILIYFQEARAQNKLHKGLETNLASLG